MRFRIKRRRMLIQQQQARLLKRSHQQRQGLTLTARQRSGFGGQTILQPQPQLGQLAAVLLAFRPPDARHQRAVPSPAERKRQISSICIAAAVPSMGS